MYSIWAELASPIKTDFRNAFLKYSERIYNAEGIKLTSYIPSEMGGNMLHQDYLMNMSEEQLPECYVTGSFGECSGKVFYKRFIETGIYDPPEIFGYFPELIAKDLVNVLFLVNMKICAVTHTKVRFVLLAVVLFRIRQLLF